MVIFVPQLLGGEVFFQESLSPSQIVETVKRERISVVITVPRILDALREKIESNYAARGEIDRFRSALAESAGRNFLRRWWTVRAIHNIFWLEVLGFVSGGATLHTDTDEILQRLCLALVSS